MNKSERARFIDLLYHLNSFFIRFSAVNLARLINPRNARDRVNILKYVKI